MTVSSELFLPAANVAPTGNGRNSSSPDKTGTQTTGNRSSENNTSGFRRLLVQETEKHPSGTPDTITKDINVAPEIVHETGDNIFSGNITSESIPATSEKPPMHTPGAESTPGPVSLRAVESQITSGHTVPDIPAPPISAAHQAVQKGNKPEKPVAEKPLINTVPTQDQNITQDTAKPENIGTGSSPRQTTDGHVIQSIGRADTAGASVSPEFDETATPLSQAPKDPNIPEAEERPPQSTPPKNILLQADGNKIPADEKPAWQTAAGAETVARQSVTPQQQMAAATAIPAQKTAFENNRAEKDSSSRNSSTRNLSKGAENAAENARNRTGSSENINGPSRNGSAENNPAAGVQNNPSSAVLQQLLSPKIPFSAELSHTMIGAEGRGLSTMQLPPGLLAVQEAGPNGLQANGLATQIKTQLPPVSPHMITKQISMAITKQAGNGLESFKISLKPAHLGQVDIKMDFQAGGKIMATVTVDNERTLALLQRDQGSLEKALENAGFDTRGNNLNFSLKEQHHNRGHSDFADHDTADGENDDMPVRQESIISHRQMKMAYSDNLLDLNI